MTVKETQNTIDEMLNDAKTGKISLNQKQTEALINVYSLMRFHINKEIIHIDGDEYCPECNEQLDGWEYCCPHCGQLVGDDR